MLPRVFYNVSAKSDYRVTSWQFTVDFLMTFISLRIDLTPEFFSTFSFGSIVSNLLASRPNILFNFRRVPMFRLRLSWPHSECEANKEINCSNSWSARVEVTFEAKLEIRLEFLAKLILTWFGHTIVLYIEVDLVGFDSFVYVSSGDIRLFPSCILFDVLELSSLWFLSEID